MSNTKAFATVTATLQRFIEAAVAPEFGTTVTVVNGRPQLEATNTPTVMTNLYMVTPNIAYANTDTPTRNAQGKVIRQPQLALDLHYILTFYGNENEFVPHRLMGLVMRALHIQPVLTREMIEETILYYSDSDPEDPGSNNDSLASSNLHLEPIEQVKFYLQTTSMEDLTKLWGAFFQTIPYSLSVTYKATTVLIDGDLTLEALNPVPHQLHIGFSPMPPKQAARAIALSGHITEDASLVINGILAITRAGSENDITHYALYWGYHRTTKNINQLPFVILEKTGADINYAFPTDTPLPAGATHVLVYTRNAQAEIREGKWVALPPQHAAAGISFTDEDEDADQISGTVTVTKATDETDLTHYALYWGADAASKLSNQPLIAKLAKRGSNIDYTFPANAPKPTGATHLLVFTRNGEAEMDQGVFAEINP